jgi:putative flippase GtrA
MRMAAITFGNGFRKAFFFLLAGGTGFLLYLCISNGMHYVFHVREVVSAIVATLLSALPTFWMQRRLTFRSDRPKRKSLPLYVLLQVGNAALIGVLTSAGVRMGLPGAVIFFIAGIAGALTSYAVQAKFIFTQP